MYVSAQLRSLRASVTLLIHTVIMTYPQHDISTATTVVLIIFIVLRTIRSAHNFHSGSGCVGLGMEGWVGWWVQQQRQRIPIVDHSKNN